MRLEDGPPRPAGGRGGAHDEEERESGMFALLTLPRGRISDESRRTAPDPRPEAFGIVIRPGAPLAPEPARPAVAPRLRFVTG